MIELTCKNCDCTYTKPKEYIRHLTDDTLHIVLTHFYQRQLTYCDTCRRKVESDMLKRGLPKVIDALLKSETKQ